ncbi:MAG: carboxypeptidase regulatory-like domain-containing protein, partial [Kofleriaceae bacterium]
MRRSHLVVGGAVIMFALLAVWKLRCGRGDDPSRAGGDTIVTTGSGATIRRDPNAKPGAFASIAGRVTRASDGAGIPNAVVAIARVQVDFMGNDDGDEAPSMIATTDANGAWSVQAIPPATYVVSATATGFLPNSRDRLVVPAGAHVDLDLVLTAGGTVVSGTVSDVGGGPIGGARITARLEGNPFASKPELVVLTNPEGRYQITLADGSYGLTASHEDYTRKSRQFELQGQPLSIDFVLAPGGQIRGVVVTRDDKPVPGAIVSASGRAFSSGGSSATADATGAFTLKGLDSGAISLKAIARGFTSASPTVVELGIGEQLDGVRVVVDRAFTISGRIVRAGTPAEGIPGVRAGVFSIAAKQGAISHDPSDDTGAFEIYGVRPASYMIFAIGEGVIPEIGKPVEVIDRDVTGVIVEMAAGATLSGRVEPGTVASISIEIESDKVGLGNIFEVVKIALARTTADASGEFALRSVPPGNFTLLAETTDGRKGKLPVKVTTTDQTGLVVKLEPRAVFAGKVVDANGAPVVGVHVKVTPARIGDRPASFSISDGGDRGGALTGASGAFRVVGLDPGTIQVSVSDDQGRIPWAQGEDTVKPLTFELAKAQAMTGVTLTVEARDGVIRGVVLGPDRKPTGDAWVTPRLETKATSRDDVMAVFRNSTQPVLTGADGTFVLDHLRRGTYELSVEGPRGASRVSKSGVKPGETVTLVLEPLGTLAGRVTLGAAPVAAFDIDCTPKPDAAGHIDSDDVSPERRFTNADGTYLLERMAPGEYTCNVRANAGTGTGKVTLASAPAKLDFALAPYASITGTVVHAITGEPVKGLNVLAHGDNMDTEAFGDLISGKGPVTDASGRFLIEHVPAGKGKLAVVPREAFNELATRDYTTVAGQRLDVGTIKVVPPREGGENGTIGITTANDEGKLTVASVMPEGPADLAGVRGGDRVVSIDGKPVAEMGVEIAQGYLFAGGLAIGQKVVLG